MAFMSGTSSADNIDGTSFEDVIYGLSGDDVLRGFAGNDRLNGGTGSDVMRGGTGDDIYSIDTYDDVPIEAAGEGFDIVRTQFSFYLPTGSSIEVLAIANPQSIDRLTLGGNEFANRLRGNDGGNWMEGGRGADVLEGRGSGDFLIGGTGRDRLIGGAGDDWFIFSDRLDRDVVWDFVSGVDRIDLGYIMHFEDFHFIGSSTFSHQAGQARFFNEVFQVDLNGDAAADFSIRLVGVDEVQASDFDFIASGYWDY